MTDPSPLAVLEAVVLAVRVSVAVMLANLVTAGEPEAEADGDKLPELDRLRVAVTEVVRTAVALMVAEPDTAPDADVVTDAVLDGVRLAPPEAVPDNDARPLAVELMLSVPTADSVGATVTVREPDELGEPVAEMLTALEAVPLTLRLGVAVVKSLAVPRVI